MNSDFLRRMAEATRLTRLGDVHAATAAIREALAHQTSGDGSLGAPSTVIDVEARELPDAEPASIETERPPMPIDRGIDGSTEAFLAGTFANASAQRDYKLFAPAQDGNARLPLIVMLHGCTQNPDDFAAGTAMNQLAREQGFYVLYPAQSRRANPQGCWNWFKHNHQQRGRGEPELLAQMTREVIGLHAIDPRRVYVAGLSAGGAMAAILGDAYPDIFAAVGVHSGLAAGAASDLPGALSAMQSGASPKVGRGTAIPTIVFHGDADSTVHAKNGEHVIAASAAGAESVHLERLAGGGKRPTTRRVHIAADGRVLAEHWLVHGASHAWSGGSSAGTYTDPRGPDASAEMVRFFLEHPHGRLH
ncbi:PHB depolymerase family esterase [Variovorax ureilyticus]|uniref:PHB depolymerase family esterase n=1 Tax=Variovorax ureilyticus TaxID=1836198 RepID=A0ABU8VMG2_9BURK